DDMIYSERAETYHLMGAHEKAVADYSKILSFNKMDEQTYQKRADEYCHLKEYKKAIADYTSAISLDPPDAAMYYFGRGSAYENLGMHKDADKDKEIAFKLGYPRPRK